MFKWTSIVAGIFTAVGVICLAVGAAPMSILTATVVGVLGVISLASGVAHLTMNNEPPPRQDNIPVNQPRIASQRSTPPTSNYVHKGNAISYRSKKTTTSEDNHLQPNPAPSVKSYSSTQKKTTPVPPSRVTSHNNNTPHHNIASLSSKKTTAAQKSKLETAETKLILAQSYLLERHGETRNLKKAFECYMDAAKSGHTDALIPLERLGDEMSAGQQMELSQVYETVFNNHEKAEYWRTNAKEVEQFNFK